ncbi:unnamed protein product [marine sediment metagenome]|uniref:Uncharacterized protein n=1 Tax=marine sediment metagenome TaxID=412755 RepID=X1FM66_9ZZZZ
MKTYAISDDGKSIRCLWCGMISHNIIDVEEKYCGNCKGYHVNFEGEDNVRNRNPRIPRKT